jgi:Ca-activated chloride channel family protein
MNIESGEMLSLRGVDASARVSGLLAETALIQKYKNDTGSNIELSYTFPLPVACTLLSLSVAIGERKLQGEVIPRAQAEIDYEKAIGEGHSAFRLQEIGSGMYNATLGNVMPDESVEITLTYAETLDWNGKSLRYRLPTTIAPRYGEPTGMQSWQRPETSLIAEYPLNLKVVLAGALAQSAISCASHKVIIKPSTNELSITLAKGASMDRDFILEVQCEEVSSIGVTATARNTHIAMLTLLPPGIEHNEQQRDVVLVIDCSGSMQGDSLALAKEGVLLALGSLQSNNRFGIVAFGTSFLQFDKALQPANRKNQEMARRWVSQLGDMGGTDINGALALALKLHDKQAMDILLLTDGQDWNLGESISKAKTMDVRIFSMGIGSAVAEDAVLEMAVETGGACELIAPTEDMSERIFRHFNRMRQPQMSGLVIDWSCESIWESRPNRACFAGDAYTVFAALPNTGSTSAKVSFEFAGQETTTIDIPLQAEDVAMDAIVRVAAKQHLAALGEEEKQEWAVKYQLITKETDYLITVERATDEKATEFPELQTQPQMLPAGWGGSSSVYSIECCSPVMQMDMGAYDAVAFHATPDYSHLDVPALLRSRSSSSVLQALTQDTVPYIEFLRRLRQQVARKPTGNVPKTIAALSKLNPPDELVELLKILVSEGYSEKDVLVALYAVLALSTAFDELGEVFAKQVNSFSKNTQPAPLVIARLEVVLNDLWENATIALCVASEGHYDIPAFLRK